MDRLKNKGRNKKLFDYVIIAFIISASASLSYFIIRNSGAIFSYIVDIVDKLIGALTPLIIGIILAYLFRRPVMFFEKFMGKFKGKRTLSISILYIIIIAVISSVINFIVPMIQQSLVRLIYMDLPRYSEVINNNLRQSMEWLKSNNISIQNTDIQEYVSRVSNISSIILNGVMNFAKGLTQGILNVMLAMILAFYILQNKEKLINNIKELIYLYGGKKIKDRIGQEVKEIDSIMGGYIAGILTDALIVCVLVTIGLKIVGHSYFLLMGITFGILSLIPYFGALISTTVACLLALFQGVPTVLYTLIMLVAIQQIDGNIIEPMILGDKVGLEPLGVITAILIFGSYWGITGMIIAVPFTAFIKVLFKRMIEKRRAAINTAEEDHKAVY